MWAQLTKANFHKAYLGNADLTKAWFCYDVVADYECADLSGADLAGANLTYVGLTGANLLTLNA
jgi:uncharacterized protein YjbI with pentapeptide repeats